MPEGPATPSPAPSPAGELPRAAPPGAPPPLTGVGTLAPTSTPVPLMPPGPAGVLPHEVPPLARMHLWHIQWVRDLILIGAVVGVVYVGYLLRVVTIPLMIAMALAYLFEPVVRWLRVRRICSRRTAAIGILTLLGLLVVVPITLGAGFAIVEITRATANLAQGASSVQKSVANPADEGLREAVPEGAWTRIRDFLVGQVVKPPVDAADPGTQTPAGTVPAPAPGAQPQPVPGVQPQPAPGAQPQTAPATPQTPPPAPVPAPAPPSAPPPAEPEDTGGGVLEYLASEAEIREIGNRVIGWIGDHMGEISSALGKRVATGTTGALRGAIATFGTIGMLLFQLALLAIFFYSLSVGWGRVVDFWERFIPDQRRGRVIGILQQMDRVIAGFVRGRVTIAAILGLTLTILYWLAGVPSAFLLGPIVGLLFIVPYVNVIGVPVAMLLMWLNNVQGPIFAPDMFEGGSAFWYILIAPAAIYGVGQLLDDWVLSPLIQGKNTDLAIPTIVFASIAGGVLAGVYGLLLAIPAAACLRILAKEVFWPRLQAWARGEAPDMLPLRQAGEPPRV